MSTEEVINTSTILYCSQKTSTTQTHGSKFPTNSSSYELSTKLDQTTIHIYYNFLSIHVNLLFLLFKPEE